jgi:hypothetical protein
MSRRSSRIAMAIALVGILVVVALLTFTAHH